VAATPGRRGYRIGDTNTFLYEAFQYVFDNYEANDDLTAIVMFRDDVDTGARRAIPNIKRRVDAIGKR
jgi:hypothetical protein